MSATSDAGFLLLLWLPGVFASMALGYRHVIDVLTVGFLIGLAVYSLLFSIVTVVAPDAPLWPLLRIAQAVVFLLSLPLVVKIEKQPLGCALVSAATLAALSVITRNIFRLEGWMHGPDQFLIGWIASLLQEGYEPENLGTARLHKRGFAFPLLLGAGREGFLLLSVTILLTILLVLASYRLAQVLTPGVGRGFRLTFFLFTLVVWGTTSMFWGNVFYQNSHVLTALAVTVMVRTALQLLGPPQESWAMAFSLFSSGYVLAQARAETFLLALLLALSVITTARLHEVKLGQQLVAMSGGVVGVLVWWITVNSFVFDLAPAVLIVAGSLLPVVVSVLLVRWVPRISEWVQPLALGVLAGFFLYYLFLSPGAEDRRSTFLENTFLGQGRWGFSAAFFLVVILIALVRLSKGPVSQVFWAVITVLLFTVDAKVIDGFAMSGGLGGFSEGWADSVNRSLLHVFGPVTALAVWVLSPLEPRFSGFRGGQGRHRRLLSITRR